MLFRTLTLALVLLSLTLPASALTLNQLPDQPLANAAQRLKAKDYHGARFAALRSSDQTIRPFLLGYADLKLELWDEAAQQMGIAAQTVPLLADYALFFRGEALAKLNRNDEALPPLMKLMQEYPSSRLFRPAMMLYADALRAGGYLPQALESYTNFIERFPSGRDSLIALFNSALCRERMGQQADAAALLRKIWLNYPASPVADQAAEELRQLAAAGFAPAPYSKAELLKRGNTLFDLGRYKQAATAFAELPLRGESEDFACKVRLKQGQSLFKAKRLKDAEEVLRSVMTSSAPGNCATEGSFWLARTLDSRGKEDESFALFMSLSRLPKIGSVADDALLKAAYLKRFQRKWKEALPLFQSYLSRRPEAAKQGSVLWETAWASYQARDYPQAIGYLKQLTARDEYRERSLYWLAKSLSASGDPAGAETQMAALVAEYPFGYYVFTANRTPQAELPQPPKNLLETLPLPQNCEREKALITFGLYDEAAREIASTKKSRNNPLGVARLYLEMGNYNGAYHAMRLEKWKKDKESAQVWGIRFPLAFREDVARNAAATGVPESLIYAIIYAESSYSPSALSPVGAVGLMQIMPATAEKISKGDSTKLTRPELNIRLGARHLKELLAQNNDSVALAAAAYNAGSGSLSRWQKAMGNLPLDEFIETIPYSETREYVKKVLAVMNLYQKTYRLGTQPKAL